MSGGGVRIQAPGSVDRCQEISNNFIFNFLVLYLFDNNKQCKMKTNE